MMVDGNRARLRVKVNNDDAGEEKYFWIFENRNAFDEKIAFRFEICMCF